MRKSNNDDTQIVMSRKTNFRIVEIVGRLIYCIDNDFLRSIDKMSCHRFRRVRRRAVPCHARPWCLMLGAFLFAAAVVFFLMRICQNNAKREKTYLTVANVDVCRVCTTDTADTVGLCRSLYKREMLHGAHLKHNIHIYYICNVLNGKRKQELGEWGNLF